MPYILSSENEDSKRTANIIFLKTKITNFKNTYLNFTENIKTTVLTKKCNNRCKGGIPALK